MKVKIERYSDATDITTMVKMVLDAPENGKIRSIKDIKDAYGLGLMEAKDFVETVREARRQVTLKHERAERERSQSIGDMIREAERLDDEDERQEFEERLGNNLKRVFADCDDPDCPCRDGHDGHCDGYPV